MDTFNEKIIPKFKIERMIEFVTHPKTEQTQLRVNINRITYYNPQHVVKISVDDTDLIITTVNGTDVHKTKIPSRKLQKEVDDLFLGRDVSYGF